MSALVVVEDVLKIYGKGEAEVRALDGVSLEIEEGDFVAVMGPSGSGKSTFMNLLGCLDVPTSCTFTLRGVNIGRLDRDSLALLRRPARARRPTRSGARARASQRRGVRRCRFACPMAVERGSQAACEHCRTRGLAGEPIWLCSLAG